MLNSFFSWRYPKYSADIEVAVLSASQCFAIARYSSDAINSQMLFFRQAQYGSAGIMALPN
tara:strand:- start:546 stop:728 length:183 start_codon:yes stop_codon:yes gene_type:complete